LFFFLQITTLARFSLFPRWPFRFAHLPRARSTVAHHDFLLSYVEGANLIVLFDRLPVCGILHLFSFLSLWSSCKERRTPMAEKCLFPFQGNLGCAHHQSACCTLAVVVSATLSVTFFLLNQFLSRVEMFLVDDYG